MTLLDLADPIIGFGREIFLLCRKATLFNHRCRFGLALETGELRMDAMQVGAIEIRKDPMATRTNEASGPDSEISGGLSAQPAREPAMASRWIGISVVESFARHKEDRLSAVDPFDEHPGTGSNPHDFGDPTAHTSALTRFVSDTRPGGA